MERHGANRNQDYGIILFIVAILCNCVLLIVMCRISTLLLTDKCKQYGSHGNTLTGHVIINDLLQPSCSIMGEWLQSFNHTHFTECLQANAMQVMMHVLGGVANVLQNCIQWYYCQLHRYISNWQVEPFLLLLMGDLPLLLTFMQHQLLPLVNSQLVGVANQLQVLVDDAKRLHEKLAKQCAIIKVGFIVVNQILSPVV